MKTSVSLKAILLAGLLCLLAIASDTACVYAQSFSNNSSEQSTGTITFGLQYGRHEYLADANVALYRMLGYNVSTGHDDLELVNIPGNPLNASNVVFCGDSLYRFYGVPYGDYEIVATREDKTWQAFTSSTPDSADCVLSVMVDNPGNKVPGTVNLDRNTIYGWTTDIYGSNIGNATVTLFRQNGRYGTPVLATEIENNPVMSGTGDYRGFYSFGNVSPGWYKLTAVKDSQIVEWVLDFRADEENGRRVYTTLPYGMTWLERAVEELPGVSNLSSDAPYAVSQNSSSPEDLWTTSLNDTIRSITQDGKGGLFAFGQRTVYSLDEAGKQRWSYEIPSQWRLNRPCWRNLYDMNEPPYGPNLMKMGSRPIYDVKDGYLYVYLTPNASYPTLDNDYQGAGSVDMAALSWVVMAISPEGKVLWTLPLPTGIEFADTTTIRALGDRVYVFHDYTEIVADKNGKVLFTIPDISDPAAVDEAGNLYVTPATPRDMRSSTRRYTDSAFDYGILDYRVPSRIVEAYSNDGTRSWSIDIGTEIIRQYIAEEVRQQYGSLPLYQQDTLYVPVRDGVLAYSTNGSLKWSARMGEAYKLFMHMPIDSENNVYLAYDEGSSSLGDTWLHVLNDEGNVIADSRVYSEIIDSRTSPAARDGIIYYVITRNLDWEVPVENMPYAIVAAYDIYNDTILWAHTINPGVEHEIVIDADNVGEITDFIDPDEYPDVLLGTNLTRGVSPGTANRVVFTEVRPSGDVIYVSFRALKYEYPVILGTSRAAYASDIYALSLNGTPVYRTKTSSLITAMAVNNSTVFFSTGGGNISAVAAGIVAGLTLLATIAIVAKFLLFGTVSRGRARLDSNENRNRVVAFVKEHPGSTLYEISRSTNMNMGTVRYHAFILSINHKITTFSDGKFVRYFPNSNTYSKEDQQIISLMRRVATGRIINALLDAPGISNADLCERLGQPESAISKLLKVLTLKGIAVRENTPDGRQIYYLSDAAVEKAARFFRYIGDIDGTTPGSSGRF
ncbi:winged helix-turn-helix transcriptional regulator [Methanocella arvoryzae]|uniref:HTH marR-type domain-containing protein n=1 Tax=Methanocella arvoryzae (strain DSM 22066 / NBRC 105507 / MRE50) TaxID=351160 RepID=Q0W7Y4_METAR|nr:winged helix-turn-helix transcriptional regulator [Methanocella arvoryzae]CAJ35509.1 hypothetical protein LRC582 [Methanocella arvoryzae MRE50]